MKTYFLLIFTLATFLFSSKNASANLCPKFFSNSLSKPGPMPNIINNKLTDLFETLFSNSKFKSIDNYIEEIYRIAKTDESTAMYLEILENKEYEIVTVQPDSEKIRDSIAKNGILSMHITKTSQANYEGINKARINSEASYLSMSTKLYKRLPDLNKPVYAFLRPPIGRGIETPQKLPTGDRYIIKERSEMTWTPGDSYNRLFMDRIDLGKKSLGIGLLTPGNLGVLGILPISRKPKHWDQIFIPWKYHLMLAGLLGGTIFTNRIDVPPSFAVKQEKLVFGEHPELQLKASLNPAGRTFLHDWLEGNYIEVQVWGQYKNKPAVTLDDVSAFEFIHTPPSGAFLKSLIKHNIEIRDARYTTTGHSNQGVIWNSKEQNVQ